MTGLVERRNQMGFWSGGITWTRLTTRTPPPCDDCWVNVHTHGGTDRRIPRARWKRVTGGDDDATTTRLCDTHRNEWDTWTPGQTALGGPT